jgi:hypothetical protein
MPFRKNIDLKPIARAIFDMVKTHQKATDEHAQEWAEVMIEHACRKLEIFVKPAVSVKALALAKKHGLDLGKLRWKPSKTKGIIHWEHFIPVASMRHRVIEAKNVEAVQSIIEEADIVWVTEKEDARLKKKGYKSKKRSTSKMAHEAYKACKIKILR